MRTKLIIILSLIFFLPLISYSQSNKIKGYIKSLDKASAEEKPGIYYKIADEYLKTDLVSAEKYATDGLKLAKKTKNNEDLADFYAILGVIDLENLQYKNASKNFDKELEFRLILNKNGDIAICYFNIGTCHDNNSNEIKAINAFESCLKYSKLAGYQKLMLKTYEALVNLSVKKANYKDAYTYFKSYWQIKDSTFKLQKNSELIILRRQKAKTEEELKTTDSTLKVVDSTLSVVDSTLKVVDSTLTVVSGENEQLTQLTEEQRQKIEILNLEEEVKATKIKAQRLQLNILLISILLILVITFFIFQRYLYKRKVNKQLKKQNNIITQQNEEIKAQNEEIKVQKEEIEIQKNTAENQRDEIGKKNKKITDSINYAQKIQSTIIPQIEIINNYLPHNFVFFKPRDIVSGDFYWFSKISFGKNGEIHINENVVCEKELFIFTAADCTGHGIPGAFMSMLGISFLNETVFFNQVFEADQILNTLREKIKKALRQTGKMIEQKDGMDMAMCVLDKKNMKMEFAGANNPLLLVRKNKLTENYEVIEYKGDLMPVGIQSENDPPFKKHTVNLEKNDACYIFSDGYFDQFGGPKNKKFLLKNFHGVITGIQEKSMPEQQEHIINVLEKWQGTKEQVDDILIIGVKFDDVN